MSKILELETLIKKDEEKIEALKKRIANRQKKIEEIKSTEYLGILNELNFSHEEVKEFLMSLKAEQESEQEKDSDVVEVS